MRDEELDELMRKSLVISSILLVFGIVSLCVSLVIDIRIENNIHWFQRSGAIVSVTSVGVEFWLAKVRSDIVISGSAYVAEFKWRDKYGGWYRTISKIAIFTLGIGALVWGYGDLPFKNS